MMGFLPPPGGPMAHTNEISTRRRKSPAKMRNGTFSKGAKTCMLHRNQNSDNVVFSLQLSQFSVADFRKNMNNDVR